MARRELATAAAELLIINRPSARDLAVVEQRFHLHPLDLEALFTVPQKSSGQSYGQYYRLTLTWPELAGGRLRLADAVFFVQADALAVVSHYPSLTLAAVMSVWQHQAHDDQRSTIALLVDCLAVIARSIESSVAATMVDQEMLASITTALQVLPAASAKLNMAMAPDLAQHLALIQHRLKYAGETLLTAKHPLGPSPATNNRLGRLVRGYALASAGLIILVIAAVTR